MSEQLVDLREILKGLHDYEGGCDEPECVVPLCRGCHRDFDQRRLELLPHLEPAYRAELAHGLRHLSLAALVERVTLRPT